MKLTEDPAATRERTDDVDGRLAQKERRRARHAHELTELLNQRTDLLGVNPTAEFVAESVRWCA